MLTLNAKVRILSTNSKEGEELYNIILLREHDPSGRVRATIGDQSFLILMEYIRGNFLFIVDSTNYNVNSTM
jgi:hypothetical protein